MLQVEHLSKRFGPVTALDDVSFELAEGEIVGLLGENGAGKTTTLRLMAGELLPSRGRVSIDGRDLFSDVVLTRRKVGYLPEQLPLDPHMRVGAFLDYVARLRGLNARERRAGVAQVLDSCGLAQLTDRSVGALSRGGRMRVGLAQALVHNPEVVLLDEPTAGLDPQQVLNMRKLILSLAGHHTILFSSHNLTEVAAVCNRIVFLKEGRLVAEDVLSTVSEEGGELLLMRFSVAPPDLCSQLAAMPAVASAEPVPAGGPGAVSVQLHAGEGLRETLVERVAMMGWGLCEMRPMAGNLTAFFQHHAGTPSEPPTEPEAAPDTPPDAPLDDSPADKTEPEPEAPEASVSAPMDDPEAAVDEIAPVTEPVGATIEETAEEVVDPPGDESIDPPGDELVDAPLDEPAHETVTALANTSPSEPPSESIEPIADSPVDEAVTDDADITDAPPSVPSSDPVASEPVASQSPASASDPDGLSVEAPVEMTTEMTTEMAAGPSADAATDPAGAAPISPFADPPGDDGEDPPANPFAAGPEDISDDLIDDIADLIADQITEVTLTDSPDDDADPADRSVRINLLDGDREGAESPADGADAAPGASPSEERQ